MVTSKRQMHLGVFVLGTGNHSAGWRFEEAATSGCSLPVMKQIASIAERGKLEKGDRFIFDITSHGVSFA